MFSLDNMSRINYKNEDVRKLMKLYQYKGKEFYYENILSSDILYIKKEVVKKDTYFFSQILGLDIKPNRLKLIVTKDSKPRNKDEQIVSNIKYVLSVSSERGHDFELYTNELADLARYLFNDVKRIKLENKEDDPKNSLFGHDNLRTTRDKLDYLFEKYRELLSTDDYEIVSLIINFYIDFVNLKPFNDENETIGLVLIYQLLLREHFDIIWYQSFFEYLFNNYGSFKSLTVAASYNWSSGYSQTEELTNLFINGLLINYKNIENFIRDYEFDSKLNKGDNIESTIYRLPQTFTKEDIRSHHPYVSDSTINRTLFRLRDEGIISPLGTGRSASWIRNTDGPERFNLNDNLNIFGVGVVDDEEN